MIKQKIYQIDQELILTNEVLQSYVNRFWEDVYAPCEANAIKGNKQKHLMILCKIKYSDPNNIDLGYKTIAPLRKVAFEDQELFSEYLQERLGLLIESYESLNYTEIVFSYIIKDGDISNKDRRLLTDLSNKEISFHEFNKIKLPISMNPNDYGILLTKEIMDGFTRYIVTSNKRIFQIDRYFDKMINIVTILGLTDFKWIDSQLPEGMEHLIYDKNIEKANEYNSFKRRIGKSILYFYGGELILQQKELNYKPFKKTRNKFSTN